MTPVFPTWVEPMAATLTQERFEAPEWIFERKFDGIRLLAFKNGRDVRLFSRNRLLQNDSYPTVVKAISELPARDVILDGEATGVWGRRGEVTYNLFDILWCKGRDLTPLPLDQRRELLTKLSFRSPLSLVERLSGAKPWERACREGWEGVIAKRRDSQVRATTLAQLAQDEVRGDARARGRRVYGPSGNARRTRSIARRLLRRQGLRLRGQGRHRLRYKVAARPSAEARQARVEDITLHHRDRAAEGAPTGSAPRSSSRWRSSNGLFTASCVILASWASASTRTRARS